MTANGPTPRVDAVHWLWHQQGGLVRGFGADVLTGLIAGLILISGGRQHTHAAAFNVMNTNGGPVAWGLVALALGAALLAGGLAGSRWGVIAPMWALALYYVILALSFGLSVWLDPDHGGSYLGVLWTSRCAFMHVSRAAVYYTEGKAWTE